MFVVGFATREEILELEEQGYEVEDAREFGRVVGPELGTLMVPPMAGPSDTRAIAVFVDAAAFDVLTSELASEHIDSQPIGKLECHKPDDPRVWPELEPDEEFLRIVLLQSRIQGQDITVEPYTSWRDELEWRRTDKHVFRMTRLDFTRLPVEKIRELDMTYVRLKARFSDQYELAQNQRRELCSHKYQDGADATVSVPVSAERFCRTCGAQFD